MDIPPDRSWLLNCAAAFAVIMLLCGILSLWKFPSAPLDITNEERDRAVLRYNTSPTPTVALVGSSLTAIIGESNFEKIAVRNLAITGGSNLTGLTIILGHETLPKLIAVEANLLDRGVDEDLIARHNFDDKEFRMIQPIRAIVAELQKGKLERASSYNRHEVQNKLSQPPSTFDNSTYVDRLVEKYNDGHIDFAQIKSNAEKIRSAVLKLEERGARVVFYELPFPDRVAQTNYWVGMRRIAREVLGTKRDDWLVLEFPKDELRWGDGQHLDQRSSVLIAQALERAAMNKLKWRPDDH